jgi:predicted AAA+ superfamily ATPase
MYRSLTDSLQRWKTSSNRTPLILRGARQVGKSHSIVEFGTRSFDNICELNLELDRRLINCFKCRNANEICRQIELLLDKEISDGKTLLFIDEIQNSSDALVSLRAFKETRPGLHVIAAGSLLEFTLQESENFSFPVGRVSFSYLHPMSFREFLLALGHEKLVKSLSSSSVRQPCAKSIHDHLLELVRTYFFTGGMPEVLDAYRQSKSLRDARSIQNRLTQAFVADFAKYGRRYDFRRLQNILTAAPRLVGRRFKYSQIDPNTQARELKQPLLDLEHAGLVRLVRASRATGIPLGAEEREGVFKLQMLDIGLMLNALGMSDGTLPLNEFFFANEGALAEQFVGQELMCNVEPDIQPVVHFWAREALGSEAEVDFVIPLQGKIIPIEVKAGTTGTLRSLRLFMTERNSPLGVRVSQHPLSFVDGILSIPFYMIHELPRLIAEN